LSRSYRGRHGSGYWVLGLVLEDLELNWRRREDATYLFLKCDQEQWTPNYQEFE